MKKIVTIIVALVIGCNVCVLNTQAKEEFSNVPYLLVYSVDSGETILEQRADEKAYPASVTKVLTALTAYDAIENLEEKVTITEEDLAGLGLAGASVVGLKVGDQVSYSDLIYSLIIISAGDSAQALGNHLFGNEEEAAKAMNKKAQEIGMTSSHFVNLTGLHNDDHYSTARDILKLIMKARENEFIRGAMSTMKYSISTNNEGGQIVFMHTIQMAKMNSEIVENYITGGKTGSTNEARSNLASFGEANRINYIVITLGVNSDEDSFAAVKQNIKVYEYLDSNYQKYEMFPANTTIGTINIQHSNTRNYKIQTNENIYRLIDKKIPVNELSLEYHLKDSYAAPMNQGDVLGSVDLMYQDEVVSNYELILDQDIDYNTSAVILETMIQYWYVVLAVIVIITSVIVLQVKKIKERNKTRYRL